MMKKQKLNIETLMRHHSLLKNERLEYEQHWQEIAERVAPSRARFHAHRSKEDPNRFRKNDSKIYDATPALALQRFSAALASLATPKNQMWHDIKAVSLDLAEDDEVRTYTDKVRDRLFSARYAANFEMAVQECYTDAGCFGNACMYIGEHLGKSLYYRHVPLEQVFWSTNDYNEVDWVNREFALTARQAYQRFGDELPTEIVSAAKESQPHQVFWFIHSVFPNEAVEQDRKDHRGMAFISCYLSLTGNKIVGQGGFRRLPYAILRFSGAGNYGEGPCSLILPDIKQLNVMNRDMIQAAELAVMPPMLAAEDGVFSSGFNLTPGAINYGGVDRQTGRQLAVPMSFGSQMPIGLEMMEQKRMIVNDALWNTLFQVLVDAPQMTATEAMLRAQEKGALLAPAASRVEGEFLNPAIMREIDLLAMNGLLPEMPDVLEEQGGEYEIEYTNPLARYRKSDEGVAIMRSIENLAMMAQVGGEGVLEVVDFQKAAKKILEVNGVPGSIIRSDEEVAQLAEQKAQEAAAMQEQMQMMQMLQAAPVAAGAAKDFAQAEAMAGAENAAVEGEV